MFETTKGAALVTFGFFACGGQQEETSVADVPITIADVGFATPESVIHDRADDVYLVSNINGDPFAQDGNGFISRLSPDGDVLQLKWIDGESDGVTLNAPRGMALSGDVLYVTDHIVVRMFDRTSGEPLGEIPVPGAAFLNDLAADDAENIYLTDSGFGPGFNPTGADRVYRISTDGELTTLASGPELGNPNGIFVVGETVWVVAFGSGQLYQVANGGMENEGTLPTGSLDGLEIHNGQFFVSSWDGQSVLAGPAAGPFEVVVADVDAPADIGYDRNRNRLLIPLFQANEVRIVPVPAS